MDDKYDNNTQVCIHGIPSTHYRSIVIINKYIFGIYQINFTKILYNRYFIHI